MHMWKLIGDRVDQWGKDGLSNMLYWLSTQLPSLPYTFLV